MKKGRCLDSLDINRRKFLKLMAIAATGAVYPWRVAQGALENLIENFSSKVCLTGVKNGSKDRVLIEAVKNSARAATDFSWLSRGDSVFIKPALNSGNAYPATTNPEGIGAVVEHLKDDNLDFTYAFRAFMDSIRGVSIQALIKGMKDIGLKENDVDLVK